MARPYRFCLSILLWQCEARDASNIKAVKQGQELSVKRTQTVLNVFKQAYMVGQNPDKTLS
jgi:hypothetical protein